MDQIHPNSASLESHAAKLSQLKIQDEDAIFLSPLNGPPLEAALPAAAESRETKKSAPPLPPRPNLNNNSSFSKYLQNSKKVDTDEDLKPKPALKPRPDVAVAAEKQANLIQTPPPPINAPTKFNPSEDVFDSFTLARNVRLQEQTPVSEATKRNSKMTSVYFLDYYYDLITYLDQRKKRTMEFHQQIESRQMHEVHANAEWSRFCLKERETLRNRRSRLRLTAFQILLQIGQGGYGQVFLARKRDAASASSGESEYLALKKMSKRALKKMGEVQHVLTERDILTRANSEWLVKLFYAFQDMENVYLAMEFVPGGDVRTLLNNSGCLREEHARFYISEMATSVSELHRLGFLHRDLKPENFLIDKNGHLKLTDFGLSRGSLSDECIASLKMKLEKAKGTPYIYKSFTDRKNMYKSVRRNDDMRCFSQVGSPDYMAPEVLTKNGSGYSLAVDYWSLGCILFEALCGFPPFTGATTDDIWVNVYHWQRVLERPVYTGDDAEFNLSDIAWNLVTKLIALPQYRISSLSALQSHPFFVNYPFTDLRLMTPPFVPQLTSSIDTSYFDDFSNPNDMAMYKEVKDRQAKLEKKLEESEQQRDDKNNGGSNFFKRLGSVGGIMGGSPVLQHRAGRDDEGLRSAFVGFTYKHK